MASVNFNAAATSALRNLQNTNTQLDATQNRISTGLKIGEAKDNAAYWSISTTMKSDNKALSTVSDALGLGAATVDTAYEGLNSTLDVLNDIKSKITAASQDGVDKAAVQSEIEELQKQLKSIATASSFSGENWLSVNSSVAGYSADKSVVSSFNRDASGNVTLATIGIDTSSLVLIDGSTTKEGILDAGKSGNATLKGGLDTATNKGTATAGEVTVATPYSYVAGAGNAGGATLTSTIAIDGRDYALSLTAGQFESGTLLAQSINNAIGSAGVASFDGANIVITSNTKGSSSSVEIKTTTFTADATATAANNTFAGLEVTAKDDGTQGAATTTMTGTFGGTAIELDANDTISFQIAANGADARTVTITRDTVTAALGKDADGTIADANEYAQVLTKALQDAGVSGVTVSTNANRIKLDSLVEGEKSEITISDVKASSGQSILDIDVASASTTQLTAFLNTVSSAIDKVTSAASTLGAVSSRIELQTDFVTKLMDTIDSGVSGLVDADMNEESTKLQALQVKQQLGVQALSIANQSAQNVLALFR